MDLVIGRELEVLGSHGMAAHAYPEMLALVAAGRLRPDRLVTTRIGLEEAPQALVAMSDASPVGITVILPTQKDSNGENLVAHGGHRHDRPVALVRRPSSRMAEGITTHVERVPADAARAARQHEAYVGALAAAGWTIREVPRPTTAPTPSSSRTRSSCSATSPCWRGPARPSARAEMAGAEEAVRALGLARRADRGRRARSTAATCSRSARPSTSGRGGRTNAEGIRQLRRRCSRRAAARSSPSRPRGAAPEVGGDRAAGRHGHRLPPLVDDPRVPGASSPCPRRRGAHVVLLGEDTC